LIKSSRELIKRNGCQRHVFLGKFIFDKAPAETKKTRVLAEPNIVKKEYIRRVSSFA
jgi:hypothetical protein